MRSDGPAVSWSSRPAARRRAIRKTGRRAWRPPAAADLWLVHWARAGIILSPRSEGVGVAEITVVHSAAAPQPKRRASALLLRLCLRCSASLCFTVFSVPSVISAHANSVSYAQYSVDGHILHAVFRLPLDDVDLLLRLDRDLDGQVSAAEIGASTALIRAYLAKHMRVVANGAPVDESLERVATWRDASAAQYVE